MQDVGSVITECPGDGGTFQTDVLQDVGGSAGRWVGWSPGGPEGVGPCQTNVLRGAGTGKV